MAYLCPHPCDGKTEYGYCRYTWCINPLHSNLGTAYQGQGVQKAIITNADRIRAMSDEELAEFINGVEAEAIRRAGRFLTVGDFQRGKEGRLDWLKQEVSE